MVQHLRGAARVTVSIRFDKVKGKDDVFVLSTGVHAHDVRIDDPDFSAAVAAKYKILV